MNGWGGTVPTMWSSIRDGDPAEAEGLMFGIRPGVKLDLFLHRIGKVDQDLHAEQCALISGKD